MIAQCSFVIKYLKAHYEELDEKWHQTHLYFLGVKMNIEKEMTSLGLK
jgi:hypothetical protein